MVELYTNRGFTMTTPLSQFIRSVEPFSTLPKKEMERLVASCRIKEFEKGETIFREGAYCDSVWVVKEGRVHLVKYLLDGKVSTTCVMAPGEIFCCLSAMDKRSYPSNAVAAVKTETLRIPIDLFSNLMAQAPFAQRAICLFCDRLRHVEGRACQMQDPAERRVGRVLLTLSKKFGETIPLTRQEVAELSGVTLETAIRVISRLKKEKLVLTSQRKTITIQPQALTSFLNRI